LRSTSNISDTINYSRSIIGSTEVAHGYMPTKLLPLFTKGINNAISYLSRSQKQRDVLKKAKIGKLDKRIFLHLPYHPQNPSSSFVQNLWQTLISLPPGQEELNRLTNWEGHHVPIKRLIVAYHRNPNLANLTSHRKLSLRTGLKPSTFIT